MQPSVDLTQLFSFTYSAPLDGGLTEHELDHVFIGSCEADPEPDPTEVDEWRWVGIDQVREWLQREPDAFTAWFPPALHRLLSPEPAVGRG
jgi:isopentenyl-diphosphate Delta-isomerase